MSLNIPLALGALRLASLLSPLPAAFGVLFGAAVA
jgi:hypothetical protein